MIDGTTPVLGAAEFAAMGFGQDAVRGTTLALTLLRRQDRLDEQSPLVARFAEPRRLVQQELFDQRDARHGN